MQRLNLNRVIANFDQRADSIVAGLHDFELVSPTLARVIMTFNAPCRDRETAALAIAKVFGGKASAVAGSFRPVASMSLPAMYGFVKLNREVRAYEESAQKQYKAMASNLLMDASDDSLWEVRSGSAGKMLVRQNQDDLSELMITARVRQHNAPTLATIVTNPVEREYAAFVDPDSEQVRYGYVLAFGELEDGSEVVEILPNPVTDGLDSNESDNQMGDGNTIADRMADNGEPVTVNVAFVVESALLEEADADNFKSFEAPADLHSNAGMKVYYKQLYGYDPAYYAEIEKMIDQHATA